MPEKFQGKYRIPSARLQGYDYGQNGAYFITICTKSRYHYFGEINLSSGGVGTQNIAFGKETQNIASLQASPIGIIANEFWQKIPEHFQFVMTDEYIVMPDHLHGILFIKKDTEDILSRQGTGYKNKFGPQSGNISSVIRGYKAGVTAFASANKIEFAWQARFYDHVIRDENELIRSRKYIVENPENWFRDCNNKEGLYR